MPKVSINPIWSVTQNGTNVLQPKVLELLSLIYSEGNLAKACKKNNSSYRYSWNLIKEAEKKLNQKLIISTIGKGSELSPLASKLVWAGLRISARLSPMLETLASELETEINNLLSPSFSENLNINASHGYAVEKLINLLIDSGHSVERKYVGSREALASLASGACEIAGFPIPSGDFENIAIKNYLKGINEKTTSFIQIAKREQGLIVNKSNPKKIYSIKDLTRKDIRFINRQPSSGTYFLLECLLNKNKIRSEEINGFQQGEYTHAAVAAFVASGMADVGLGLETPARNFDLDFIPIASERYFVAFNKETLNKNKLQKLISIIEDKEFEKTINGLPGYSFSNCGNIQKFDQVFESSS